jgi:copper(I)-binding protein
MQRLATTLSALGIALAFALPVRAADAPVTVEGAWARATVQGQDSSGAYMSLTTREPLTLLGAQTPAAGIVEIHEMRMQGDVMKMRAAETLPLVPGKPLRLAPGGYHFMLMDLKAPFKAGTQLPLTLRFRDAKGGTRTLAVNVPISLTPPAAKH